MDANGPASYFIITVLGFGLLASAALVGAGACVHRRRHQALGRTRSQMQVILTTWGVFPSSASPDAAVLDALAQDVRTIQVRVMISFGLGLAAGCAVSSALVEATAGTLLTYDFFAINAVAGIVGAGFVVGGISGFLSYPHWSVPAPEADSAPATSLHMARLVTVLGVILVMVLISVTAGQQFGWLPSTRTTLLLASLGTSHPWLIWLTPACAAIALGCMFLLLLRLRAMPLFPSLPPDLSLAAGRGWHRQMRNAAPSWGIMLGTLGIPQVTLLQLDLPFLSLGLIFFFLIFSVAGTMIGIIAAVPPSPAGQASV